MTQATGEISRLIQEALDSRVRGTDRQTLEVSSDSDNGRTPKLSDRDLLEYEQRIGTRFPQELSEWFLRTNGMILFDSVVFNLHIATYFPEMKLLALRDWGSVRDIDCIALEGSPFPLGSVVFMNGNPSRTLMYQPGLLTWLRKVIDEVRQAKDFHLPCNYNKFRVRHGVAAAVVPHAHEQGWNIAPATSEEIKRAYPDLYTVRWVGGRLLDQ